MCRQYEDQRSTELAVDNFNGTKVLGRTLRVDHCEKYKLPKEARLLERFPPTSSSSSLASLSLLFARFLPKEARSLERARCPVSSVSSLLFFSSLSSKSSLPSVARQCSFPVRDCDDATRVAGGEQ